MCRPFFRPLLRRWPLLAFVLAVPTVPARGLEPRVRITQFSHDVWQQRDGLPSSVVQAIAQTPDGYLWLGTPTGLVRFDGASFTEVPTDPNDPKRREYVFCLTVGPDGDLWVGTRFAGVRRVTRGRLTNVNMPGIDKVVRALAFDPEGRLNIATGTALIQMLPEGRLVQKPTRESYIQSLARDARGRVWVGYGLGVDLADGDRPLRQVMTQPLPVNAVASDRDDNIWIGTDSGLWRWKNDHLQPWAAPSGIATHRIFALCGDPDGSVWIGTQDGLERVTRNATPDSPPELLRLGQVTSLCQDREGSLWVGTAAGLHRLKMGKVTPWGQAEGVLADNTLGLAAGRDGSVFILSNLTTGVTEIRNNRVVGTSTSIVDGPAYVARDGALWVGTSGTLARMKAGRIDHFGAEDGLLKPWISAIAEDERGMLLCFSQLEGIRRWDGHRVFLYRFRDGTECTVPFHQMMMYSAPDQSVWAAGYDGIWHLDHGEITRYVNAAGQQDKDDWYRTHPQNPKYFHTVVTEGAADFWQTSIADEGQGTFWFASQRGGLTRLRKGVLTAFTTRQGLSTNQLYSVLVDGRGSLWMGTPAGIMRVSESQLDEVATGRRAAVECELFTHHDGLRNDECNDTYQPSAARAADGTLWFTTKNGVVAIDPAALRRNLVPPPVRIEQVLVDGRDWRETAAPALPPPSQKFEFRYTALSLLVPERVRFKYQLVGYDRDWIDAGPVRQTQYTRLPPGSYRFRVRACNNDGVWNEAGDSFAFTLRPHYYETLWFYALCTAAALLAVYGGHQWRVRGLKDREVRLQARVTERTAELSRTNAELKVEIAERERVEQQVERIHRDLMTASHQAGMAQVATGVLHNVGNILNSVNVSTEMLAQTLKQSRLRNLERVIRLLNEHAGDLGTFLTSDPKGRQIPTYLEQASALVLADEAVLNREVDELRNNVEHIRQIVAMQQQYAKVGGVVEPAMPAELMEDALRINSGGLARHGITVEREYDPQTPTLTVEKHKVLQILVNFIQNAKYACDATGRSDKVVRLVVRPHEAGVSFAVMDNGVGIPAEQIGMIFTYGFTTRKDGHGFGLHTGVLAAREMGGDLRVSSPGSQAGATFELVLPLEAASGAANLAEVGASGNGSG